ncbi:MAG: hypothetical protein KA831_06660, partial [Pyrinomonadaceae bacterium]|nr:hypothetical protein [Pyrinomonadaceae bacterium]
TTTVNGQQPNGIHGDVFEGTGIKTKRKTSPGVQVPTNNSNARSTNTTTTTANGQPPNGIYGDVQEGTGIKTKRKNSAASSVPANNANTTQGQPATSTAKPKKQKRRKN